MTDTLLANVDMTKGDKLVSQNGSFEFRYQIDGNACVYDISSATPIFCTDTQGGAPFFIQKI